MRYTHLCARKERSTEQSGGSSARASLTPQPRFLWQVPQVQRTYALHKAPLWSDRERAARTCVSARTWRTTCEKYESLADGG